MENTEVTAAQYAKQLEESMEEARRQTIAATNKSQALASQTANLKNEKEQRYRNILAKVHKEKDTNRKLQIKLKQLTNILNEAKIVSDKEIEELNSKLKVELFDRKQAEADMKVSFFPFLFVYLF